MGEEVIRNKRGRLQKGTKGINPEGKNNPDLTRATAIAKSIVAISMEWYLPRLEEDLKEVTPKERLDVICKLMNYVLATKKSEDVNFGKSEDVEIQFRFGDWKGGSDGK